MNLFIRMVLSIILCVSLGVLTLVVVKQGGKKTDSRHHRIASGSVTEEKAVVAKKATPRAITPQPEVKQPEVLAKAGPRSATSQADFSNSPVVRKGPSENDAVALAQFSNSPVVRKQEPPKPAPQTRHQTEEKSQERLNDPCYVQSLYTRVDQEKCRNARLGPPHVVERTARKEQTSVVKVPTDLVALIKHHFHDAPIMLKVAECESGIRHTLPDGRVIRGGLTPADVGLFQINTNAHGPELRQLGLDPRKLEDNMRFARILYERNGLRDWAPSEHCWKGKRR